VTAMSGCGGEYRAQDHSASPGKQDECRPEAGLLGEFTALGLQHGTRAKRSLHGVRRGPQRGEASLLAAGGAEAADSCHIAADSGLLRPLLLEDRHRLPGGLSHPCDSGFLLPFQCLKLQYDCGFAWCCVLRNE